MVLRAPRFHTVIVVWCLLLLAAFPGDASTPTVLESRQGDCPGFQTGTILGAVETDQVYISEIAVDSMGNVFVAGRTNSDQFPTTTGAFDSSLNGSSDLFVTKFDPGLSTILMSTYIGGSSTETVEELLVSPDGGVLVAGSTSSSDFPTTGGAFCGTYGGAGDGFLLELNAQGTDLEYSTFIGGSKADVVTGMDVDASGGVLLSGYTSSADFPVTTGAYDARLDGNMDAFALRFRSGYAGPDFCTLLGGPGSDSSLGVRLLGNGSFTMFGWTDGAFPLTPGAYNASSGGGFYFLRMDTTATGLEFSTMGPDGSGDEDFSAIDVDDAGNIYVVGTSESTDFPTTPDALYGGLDGTRNGILFIVSGDGRELAYSTYIHSGGPNFLYDAALDGGCARLAVVGGLKGDGLPVTVNAFDDTWRGEAADRWDGCLLVLNLTSRDLEYGTYIGGSDNDFFDSVAWSDDGVVHLSGRATSRDVYTGEGAYQGVHPGADQGYVVKIDPRPGRVPGAPTDLVGVPSTVDVVLTWERPAEEGGCRIEGYVVEKQDPSGAWVVLNDSYVFRWTDEDVVNGEQTKYRVSAVSDAGQGSFATVTVSIPPVVPTAPRDLRATTGNGTVVLNWSAPEWSGGARVLGYDVFRGPTTVDMPLIGQVGNAFSYVDNDVELGEFYFYKVTARNSAGSGPTSNTVRVRALDVPSPPRDFRAEPGDGEVILSWAPPGSTGGSMLLGFRIYRGDSPGTMALLATKGPVDLSHTDTGLTNGRTYIYYLTAFSEVNESVPTVALDAVPFSVPGAPLNLEVEPGDGWLLLGWDPPEKDGGSRILRYIVLRGESPTELVQVATLGNVTSFNNTGLANGVAYHYAVVAVNAAGEGPRSVTASGRPMGLPSAPTDLAGVSTLDGVLLTWHAPADKGGADDLSYKLYRGPNENDLSLRTTVLGVFSFLDTSVTSGTWYFYVVAAENGMGEGPSSAAMVIIWSSAPGIVQDVELRPMDGRVELFWMVPLSDGGSPITGYVVHRGLFETALKEVARVGAVLNYTDAAVENGKRYFYAVQALNAIGPGPLSTPSPATPLGVPRAPGVLKAGVEGSAVVITWAAPSEGGRAAVTGYVVLRGLDPAGLTELAEVGNVLSYTDATVEKGKTYYYLVVANSTSGRGEAPTAPVKVKLEERKEDGPGPGSGAALVAMMASAAVMLIRAGKRRGR